MTSRFSAGGSPPHLKSGMDEAFRISPFDHGHPRHVELGLLGGTSLPGGLEGKGLRELVLNEISPDESCVASAVLSAEVRVGEKLLSEGALALDPNEVAVRVALIGAGVDPADVFGVRPVRFIPVAAAPENGGRVGGLHGAVHLVGEVHRVGAWQVWEALS